MFQGIDAVIFDLDGTLVDSMWMWKEIDMEYLERFQIECPEDLTGSIEGMSFSETASYFKERFGLKDTLEQIKQDWNRMAVDKYKNEVNLKSGALELLKYLKNSGIKTGIATSNSRELVDAVLESLGIRGYFDAVHTSCEVKKGKPAPDIYLHVAEKLSVKPEACIVFEDILQGIMAGKNAGMFTCAVYDKYSAWQETEKRNAADLYIEDFAVLLSGLS